MSKRVLPCSECLLETQKLLMDFNCRLVKTLDNLMDLDHHQNSHGQLRQRRAQLQQKLLEHMEIKILVLLKFQDTITYQMVKPITTTMIRLCQTTFRKKKMMVL